MPAGGAAVNAEVVRVDVVLSGVVMNETNGAMEVFQDFGNRVTGLAAVGDFEDGVAAPEKFARECATDGSLVRHPAAADHEEDAAVIGMIERGETLERQRGPPFATVNDVINTGESRLRQILTDQRAGKSSDEEKRKRQDQSEFWEGCIHCRLIGTSSRAI